MKCVDGAVIVSDSKITYTDHPPSDTAKLHSEFYHIVTGGAGSTDLYDEFRHHALYATQPGVALTPQPRLFAYHLLPLEEEKNDNACRVRKYTCTSS